MEKEIPPELKRHLGTYGPQLFDSYCSEPIMWGYKILHYLGDELWQKMQKYGTMECASESGNWYLITEKLTPEKAIEKYGPVTDLELGPRGGFRSVTYGEKQFCSRELRPL